MSRVFQEFKSAIESLEEIDEPTGRRGSRFNQKRADHELAEDFRTQGLEAEQFLDRLTEQGEDLEALASDVEEARRRNILMTSFDSHFESAGVEQLIRDDQLGLQFVEEMADPLRTQDRTDYFILRPEQVDMEDYQIWKQDLERPEWTKYQKYLRNVIRI